MAISNIIKKVANKVVDVTSDVLSAPARMNAAAAKTKADNDVAAIKTVRAMKGVPDKGDQSDPLFRARAVVSNLKTDNANYAADYAKKMSPKPKRF